jgi:hypothetical protein
VEIMVTRPHGWSKLTQNNFMANQMLTMNPNRSGP